MPTAVVPEDEMRSFCEAVQSAARKRLILNAVAEGVVAHVRNSAVKGNWPEVRSYMDGVAAMLPQPARR